MKKIYTILNSFKIKEVILFGLFFFFYTINYCQNQKIADSLELIYTSSSYKKQDQLKILGNLAGSHVAPDKQLMYSIKLIQLAKELDSPDYLWAGYTYKGTAHRNMGNYNKALESHINAAEIAIEKEQNSNLGSAYITIGDVYSLMGNHENSINYYNKAIDIMRKEDNSNGLATALYNAGDEYFNIKKYDSAKLYFRESGIIFKNQNDLMSLAFNQGSIGMIHAEQGNYALAEQNIGQAIKILEEQKIFSPISEFLIYMSDIYVTKNDLKTAFKYAHKSLELAQKYGQKKQISDTSLKLSKLYELNNNLPESFKYYKNYIVYRDSVRNIDAVQQMANLRTDFEVQKKQDEIGFLEKEAEINQLKDKRNKTITYTTAISAFLFLMIALGIYRRYRFINRTNKIIQKETDKSEKLLLNILPEETAKELKQNGKVQAKQFGSVSVMFTDFKEFTHFSQNLSPEILVKSVDYYFSKFDSIIEKHGLEKIKTIGDAYMCAGGLPFPTNDHADKMIQAAFEIAEFMETSKKVKDESIKSFEVRIGINTGPVVAGVVGTKKFAYDIWGDTVNVASRMESNSLPGKINISETTYDLIKDKYECKYRGEINVKNKGMMKMYFVQGYKTVNAKINLVKQKSEL